MTKLARAESIFLLSVTKSRQMPLILSHKNVLISLKGIFCLICLALLTSANTFLLLAEHVFKSTLGI
uniref:Uncharacterized protein n=1 Tax=Anguilla anguilla TaxID=7936 RepID=A0A0E9S1J6_ANGAN